VEVLVEEQYILVEMKEEEGTVEIQEYRQV
jgi:hypothetical protein